MKMKATSLIITLIGLCLSTTDAVHASASNFLSSPLIPLNSNSSQAMSLGSLKGKVVLVDFWATWCVPCRASFPIYEGLHKKYASQGLVIVGVNNEDDAEAVKNFYTNLEITFLIVKDENNALGKLMNPEKMPTSYILDRQGSIVYTHPGFFSGDEVEIEQKIKEVLARKG